MMDGLNWIGLDGTILVRINDGSTTTVCGEPKLKAK